MVVLVPAAIAGNGFAQRPGTPPGAQQDAQAPGRHKVAGPDEDKTSRTSHTIRLNGTEVRYTATAGTVPVRLDDGKVAARMFFVAYTKDGEVAGVS